MGENNREMDLKQFIYDLVLSIRSKREGYIDVKALAADLKNDTDIDGEYTANHFGYRSLKDFLSSDVMAEHLDIKEDQNGLRFMARYDPRVAHIHTEQLRAQNAREQKQEKERHYEGSAGTIGRKFYGQDENRNNNSNINSNRFNNVGVGNNNGYNNSNYYRPNSGAASNSRGFDCYDNRYGGSQPYNDNNNKQYNCSEDNRNRSTHDEPWDTRDYGPSRPSSNFNNIGLESNNHSSFDVKRNKDQFRQEAYSDYGYRRDNTNRPESSSRSTGFGVGLERSLDNQNSDNRSDRFFDRPNSFTSRPATSSELGRASYLDQASSKNLDERVSLQSHQKVYDDAKQRNNHLISPLEPDSNLSACTQQVDDENSSYPNNERRGFGNRRFDDEYDNELDARNVVTKSSTAPEFLSNPKVPKESSMPSGTHRNESLHFTPTPSSIMAKAVSDIVWDEDEEDNDEIGHSMAGTNTIVKQPVKQVKYGSDYNDLERSDDEEDETERIKKTNDVTEKQSSPTQWTSRDKDGEYTDDSDEEETSTEEEEKKEEKKKSKDSRSPVLAYDETRSTLSKKPPQRPASSSSSETSTLHELPEKVKGELNKKPQTYISMSEPPSHSTSVGTATSARVPASHGEKWLLELNRQNATRRGSSCAEVANGMSERESIFRPVQSKLPSMSSSKKQTSDGAIPQQDSTHSLRRPIPLKPINERENMGGTFSPESDERLSKEGTTPLPCASGGTLRRSGSTLSIVSTTTSRRWNRYLSEDDLHKLARLLNVIVYYYHPRTILLDDLLSIIEMIEPRIATLEQLTGCDFLEFISKSCSEIELIGRAGNYNLLWRQTEVDGKRSNSRESS